MAFADPMEPFSPYYTAEMAHEDIVDALGGKTLGELIPQDFLARFGLDYPVQYGMVCADVRAQADRLEELGASPFVHVSTAASGWKELGLSKDVILEMALGQSDDQQIKLSGPGHNTRFFADAIPADGSMALHHVCCMPDDLDELRRRLPLAGYPLYVEGGSRRGLLSGRYASFDTRDQFGFWLELVEYRFLGRKTSPAEGSTSSLARLQQRWLGQQEPAEAYALVQVRSQK